MIASDTYMLEGSRQELATLLRCTVLDFNTTLPNLKSSEVGDVTVHSNGHVTIICRRRQREFRARENGRNRVAKHREKRSCNTESPLVSGSASDSPPGPGKGVQGEGEFRSIQLSISEHFKQPDRRWTHIEEHTLFEICKSPTALDEWQTIRSYRMKKKDFQRQTILALLENWAGELDKAVNFTPEKPRPRIAI